MKEAFKTTKHRYVCTHICSLLFIHAINPSLPEQNAISKGPCVVLDVPSGFIRSSGTCGWDRDQGSGHDLLSATRSQYCSGIHVYERELTEQDPQPQLEQSPLHEQVLQLLFKAWSADVPLSCILPIKVFPASRGGHVNTKARESHARDWWREECRGTYHGDMIDVIGW